MSYSFKVKAATRAEAKEKASAEFDKVVASQPVHATDRPAHEAAAGALVDLISNEPPEGQEVVLDVSGSMGWRGEGDYTSANVMIGARVAPVET